MAKYEAIKGDKKRRYRNTETGEIVGRREVDKAKRMGLSNEMLAKLNAISNKELSVSRPARGRSSLLKKSETERHLIAEARIEDELKRKEIAAQLKKEKFIARTKARKASKKVSRKKISTRLLKSGRMGARVPFNTYEEYIEMLGEAKATGKIVAYGLGMMGYDERDSKDLAITVFTMRMVSSVISEDDFEETMLEERESRSYFIFQHYFMHLAFKVEYVRERAATAKSRKAKK